MPVRHDHDAGGPRELLDRKAGLRDDVWAALTDANQKMAAAGAG